MKQKQKCLCFKIVFYDEMDNLTYTVSPEITKHQFVQYKQWIMSA